ncbi:MAG: hypothetical protein ACYDHE_17155 [Candidatus Acidiferrales bacterium]
MAKADPFDNSLTGRVHPRFRHELYADTHAGTRYIGNKKVRIAIQPPKQWWEERLKEWNKGVEGWRKD